MTGRGESGPRAAGIGAPWSLPALSGGCTRRRGGEKLPFLREWLRGLSFKTRADWRAFLRVPGKQKWRPIPRLFPWRLSYNPLPRRYPLYKQRSLFLPLSFASYAPQAAEGLSRTPLTITNNAANLPRTFRLQRLLLQLQPVTSSAPLSASHLEMALPSSLRFQGGARDSVYEGDFAGLSSRLLRGATPLPASEQMSPDVFSASPPERNRFSGSFLVVYSPDEFQTYLSLKNVLSRIAPYVELDACQSTGTLEEFTVTRRADNVVVFDSQSGDNTRLRQGQNGDERPTPEESTVVAAMRSILITSMV